MDIGELQFGNHMITKSIGITYDGGRDADDDAALRGLGDIDGYWVGTVGVEYAPVRPTGGTFLSAGVDAAFDLSNETNGVVVEANARLNHLLSRRLRVAHGPYVTWANENHMQAYFGISAQQARRSQYQAFSAGSGIRDVGYQVVAHYGLTESLSLLGVLNYQHLLSDAADSPLVDQEGSAGQFTSFMGVTYRF
jgi:outer membrane scaffolding protein for murein synthesis (MipA/OmpV family)